MKLGAANYIKDGLRKPEMFPDYYCYFLHAELYTEHSIELIMLQLCRLLPMSVSGPLSPSMLQFASIKTLVSDVWVKTGHGAKSRCLYCSATMRKEEWRSDDKSLTFY